MGMITSKQIINAIGCDKLKLVRGYGYWYFVYDDPAMDVRLFDTHSVYVVKLFQLPLSEWISEGKEFVAKMELLKQNRKANK